MLPLSAVFLFALTLSPAATFITGARIADGTGAPLRSCRPQMCSSVPDRTRVGLSDLRARLGGDHRIARSQLLGQWIL